MIRLDEAAAIVENEIVNGLTGASWMIGSSLEVGVKEFAAGRFGASAPRFDGHKDRINLRQNARVLEFEHPAFLFLIVHVEDSEALGWALGFPAGPPSLE